MYLAGIQEERGKGFWISILYMDRKQVVKKYSLKKRCFLENPSGEKLFEVLQSIRQEPSFWKKKKQFSQMRRPPKWVDVPPRLIFRPDEGLLREEQIEILQSVPFDIDAVLVREKPFSEKKLSFLREVDPEEICFLWDTVQEEKRMLFGEVEMPKQKSRAFYSLGIALWGGERIWRMVRYGG